MTDQIVVKEASRLLRTANAWVVTALTVEGMEEELSERWAEMVDEVLEALATWLECQK